MEPPVDGSGGERFLGVRAPHGARARDLGDVAPHASASVARERRRILTSRSGAAVDNIDRSVRLLFDASATAAARRLPEPAQTDRPVPASW